MNIVAIVQARLGSTRLPQKVLIPIQGKTVLEHIIDRVKQSKLIQCVVVATTTHLNDNVIEEHCRNIQVTCFRGDEDNVLDRFFQCASSYKADIIVRVTADDPFKDPEIIDRAINLLIDGGYDYVSNTVIPTYPEGIDIEIFTMNALVKAYKEATLLSEKEHVTPYIWKNTDKFRSCNFTYKENLSHLRWTLDKPDDLLFVQAVYQELYRKNEVFLMSDILKLIEEQPELSRFNQGHIRNEGYLKSIKNEIL